MAGGTGTVRRDIAFLAPCNRPNLLMVFIFEVRDEELPVPIVLMKLKHRSSSVLNFWYLGEWESSKAHCLRGIYLQIKVMSQQFCW